MMKLLVAMALIGFAVSPVLANECPTLQEQINKVYGKRADKTAASVKQVAREAWNLHKAGKHDEAGAKYEEAAKIGGIELKHAKLARAFAQLERAMDRFCEEATLSA